LNTMYDYVFHWNNRKTKLAIEKRMR
jgi:hypothetical protein